MLHRIMIPSSGKGFAGKTKPLGEFCSVNVEFVALSTAGMGVRGNTSVLFEMGMVLLCANGRDDADPGVFFSAATVSGPTGRNRTPRFFKSVKCWQAASRRF